MENLSFRFLNEEEYSNEVIVKVFAENGSKVPNNAIAKILIAEDRDKNIVGFQVMQPVFHMEPIWVSEEYRNTRLYYNLIKEMLEIYSKISGLQIFAFSPRGIFDRTLARFGFTKRNYAVFEKVME